MRFEGRAAIITGAASGLGLLTAPKLAEEGAVVYMTDINEAALNIAVQEICASGGKAVAMLCDVRSHEQISAVVDRCIREQGRIDIAISYAGGVPARIFGLSGDDARFENTPFEVLDWGVDVNFRAPMYLARCVMKHMMDRKNGVIINIGSTSGDTGGAVDYGAEKSGLMYGLTKGLANLGAPYGVRCCAVSPGPVLTRPGMANMKTALGRAAEPIEIVRLVLYLCSDDAAFITGVNYLIDGGRALLNNV